MGTSNVEQITPDFRILFESAPGLFLVLAPDAPRYTIVAVSDAYIEATMTKREEMLGWGLFEVFPDSPEAHDVVSLRNLRASLERVMRERVADAMEIQKYDIRRPKEEGGGFEERWWNPVNTPVFGPGGDLLYIILQVEDVTEVVHLKDANIAEQRLSAELRRVADERQIFAALIDNSSDFIGIADPSGKPVYVNPAGRRMVGLAADYPIESTQIPEYYPPEHRSFVKDEIVKSMIEQGHWKGETYFRNWQTQEPIPVSDEHFMIQDPETGRTLGMGTITRDISDIRQARDEVEAANRELRQANEEITRLNGVLEKRVEERTAAWDKAEEKFRAFMESANDTCILFDSELKLLYINPAGLAGFPEQPGLEELVGKSMEELSPGIEEDKLYQRYLRVLATGEPFTVHDVVPHSRFGRLVVDMRVFKVGDGLGIIATNVTKYKQQKAMLEHTAKLASLGELAANVVHEINNPIGIIGAKATLLRSRLDELPPRKISQELEKITNQCDRLARLTKGLLDFSRPKSRTIERLDIHVPLRAALTMIEDRAHSNHVAVIEQLQPQAAMAFGCIDGLQQVFLNLMINAIDAMPAGGTLTVSTRPSDTSKAMVVTIADTGPGVSSDSLEKIFDPFYSTKGEGGSGLGLSISQSIISLYGGSIAIETKPGVGSKFHVSLPSVEKVESIQAEGLESHAMNKTDKRVLIVDDEPGMLEVCYDSLSDLDGLLLEIEVDSIAAAERLKKEPFDLLISDLRMPKLGGQELANIAKTHQPAIQVLFMSADVPTDIPFATVTKPFTPEQLAHKVMQVLHQEEAERSQPG